MAEDEAKRLYQRALPTFLIESLQKELLKKEKYPRVIFAGHTGHAPQQIKMWLDQTFGTNFGRVAHENVGLVVQCQDKNQLSQILTLNGRMLQTGEQIQVRAMEPQLSLEDMRQICRETLQPRENAQEIKSSGPLPHRQAPRPSAVAGLVGEEEMGTHDESDEPHEVAALEGSGPSHNALAKGGYALPHHPSSSSSSIPSSQTTKPSVPTPSSQTMQNSSATPVNSHQLTILVQGDHVQPSQGKGGNGGYGNKGGNSWKGGGNKWKGGSSYKGGGGKGHNSWDDTPRPSYGKGDASTPHVNTNGGKGSSKGGGKGGKGKNPKYQGGRGGGKSQSHQGEGKGGRSEDSNANQSQ